VTGARIEPMLPGDLAEVVAIEEATFSVPWSARNFLHEIEENPFACSRVVRGPGGRIEAYACAWMVDAEVRINNIAVRQASRGRGHGEALLRHLMEEGRSHECTRVTLEVRPSNRVALTLYEKLGFRVVARRKGYYSDTHEDALVMRRRLP
jgi:ribosomal-protein-alanine N-acetyltransferase